MAHDHHAPDCRRRWRIGTEIRGCPTGAGISASGGRARRSSCGTVEGTGGLAKLVEGQHHEPRSWCARPYSCPFSSGPVKRALKPSADGAPRRPVLVLQRTPRRGSPCVLAADRRPRPRGTSLSPRVDSSRAVRSAGTRRNRPENFSPLATASGGAREVRRRPSRPCCSIRSRRVRNLVPDHHPRSAMFTMLTGTRASGHPARSRVAACAVAEASKCRGLPWLPGSERSRRRSA